MNDLISRQAAIDRIAKIKPEDINNENDRSFMAALIAAESLIKGLPSVQPEQRWIPCSERLPEEYGEYQITWTTSASKKRFIGDSEFEVTSEWDAEHYKFKGEWLLDEHIKNYPDVKVIAWMPLPEPYEGEEDGLD